MPKIKLLDKNLINQIAAGEVVERPASVVKELTENSIDAGATRIEISISNECRNIRIADNGCGIAPEDIELAFSKHATSKISSIEDLDDIMTLGFRGEALASLISIAKVTCITKQKQNQTGTKAVCENSQVIKTPTGCADGTTMEIEDLFYNLPARLKFLKNEKTEMAYITEMVQALALSHPETAITLKNKNSTVLQTFGTSQILNTISELYSPELIDELNKVSKEDSVSHLKLEGYISSPSYTRSSNKSIYLMVNNRTVKDAVILKTISNVCQNLIPKGKYPFAVLNLSMPATDVDVNVHPCKKEVKYKNTRQIFNFVYSALTEALSSTPVFCLTNEEKPVFNSSFQTSPISETQKSILPEKTFNRFLSEKPRFFETADNDCVYINSQSEVNTETAMKVYEPVAVEQKNFDVSIQQTDEVKIIGQFDNTYILVDNGDSLEIIDQHVAQERYMYEKLKSEKEISSQVLLFSDILDLEPTDVEILKKNYSELQKFGYGIEFLSEKEITFRKLPVIIAGKPPKQIIAGLLDEIYNNEGSIEEKILISMSCRSSVKANTVLLPSQMEDIVKKWRSTKQPETCPHGRPISKKIPKSQIASFFLRA